MWGMSSEDAPSGAALSRDLVEQNERIIASCPHISLSLIVGESKCDARLFFFPLPREAYIMLVFNHIRTPH